MPSAPAPFVSFNDYLDANAGSLAQERTGALNTAQAAGDKALGDIPGLNADAYKQGQAAYSTAYHGPTEWTDPSTGQLHQAAGTHQNMDPTGAVDPSKLTGYADFTKDRESALQGFNTLAAGGLGSGKNAFEAGLIGADSGFKSQADNMSKEYGDKLNNYLSGFGESYNKGYADHPAPAGPIDHTQYYDQPGTTPQEGPVSKPHRISKKQYEEQNP